MISRKARQDVKSQHWLEVLAHDGARRKWHEDWRGKWLWKQRMLRNLKPPPPPPRTGIGKFTEVAGYNTNIPESVVFLYTRNKHTENEIRDERFLRRCSNLWNEQYQEWTIRWMMDYNVSVQVGNRHTIPVGVLAGKVGEVMHGWGQGIWEITAPPSQFCLMLKLH